MRRLMDPPESQKRAIGFIVRKTRQQKMIIHIRSGRAVILLHAGMGRAGPRWIKTRLRQPLARVGCPRLRRVFG